MASNFKVMSQGHLHLIITHLPIFGVLLGGIVLFQGIWMKNGQVKLAGYTLLIISALGAVIAYVTGEAAEEMAESISGIAESVIEEHEEFAMFALIAMIATGVFSLAGFFLQWKNLLWNRSVATITLLVCLVSFALIGWTGYLGGQIRHTELNATMAIEAGPMQNGEEGDDD